MSFRWNSFEILSLIPPRCDLKRYLDEKSLFRSKRERFRIRSLVYYRGSVHAYRAACSRFYPYNVTFQVRVGLYSSPWLAGAAFNSKRLAPPNIRWDSFVASAMHHGRYGQGHRWHANPVPAGHTPVLPNTQLNRQRDDQQDDRAQSVRRPP